MGGCEAGGGDLAFDLEDFFLDLDFPPLDLDLQYLVISPLGKILDT